MILNLKHLNKYIEYRKFKMTQIYKVLDLLQPNMWATSIDLVDTYSSLNVFPLHRAYLCFQWRDQLYSFKCLPQGFSSAPQLFTKIEQPLAALLHTKMVNIVIYIDDTLLVHTDKCMLVKDIHMAINMFETCGFSVKFCKSQLTPVQVIEFLGFMINTVKFEISLTKKKRHDIMQLISHVLEQKSKTVTICLLAKIIGKIVATFPASEHSQLHYRILEHHRIKALQLSKGKWNAKTTLSPHCLTELLWWKENIFSPKMSRSQYLP